MPNLPKDVERYVQEGLDAGMPEDKAWAIAWSRWCKYKRPGDEHCKKGPEGYFTGKKASLSGQEGGVDAWVVAQRFAASKTITTVKGKLPPQRDPAAREMALNPPSGGGKHKNKQDYARGRARNPKHRNQVDKEADGSLSLRRDYDGLDAAWGDTIYDA